MKTATGEGESDNINNNAPSFITLLYLVFKAWRTGAEVKSLFE